MSNWRVFKLEGLGIPQDRITACVSVVLPNLYALSSDSQQMILANHPGPQVAMDSEANSFMFTAQFAVPGSIVPSHHCLISATSGGTQISLERAEVVFGMYDSDSCLHVFRQSAFLHSALLLVLFPLSMLADAGCFFDFYGTVGLSRGDIFLPFQKQDGLYLAPIFPVPFDSPVISDFLPVTAALSVSMGLPAVTRSSLRTGRLTNASSSVADSGSSTFNANDNLVALGENAVVASEDLVSLADEFASRQEKDGLQPLRFTGDGARLFAGHRRYGHLHDRVFKRMIDAGLCGKLKWVKGLALRENCWDCLKGQQKRNIPAPGPNLETLHPRACQIMVWDWCGPHHVSGLHGELYWFLAVSLRPPHDSMLLGTHVDDFMLAASSTNLADKFAAHFGQSFSCKKSIAREFVGMYIIRDQNARKIYLSHCLLIDRLLETEFDGIMQREGLTGYDLLYNPGHALQKWEALCPCSTPFDSKMSRISVDDCPAMPDPGLVHWMQVTVGFLLYTLHTRPDIMHSVHQLSRIVHNPGPSHVKAVDHLLRSLAGTVALTFVIGNWTEIDRRFASGFHSNYDASHKNAELNYRGITGGAVFFSVLWFCLDHLCKIRLQSRPVNVKIMYSAGVKDMEYVRLLIRDLAGLGLDLPTIPTLYADCEPAIAVAKGASTRSRTRHIDFEIWLCRDYVRRELVQLVYVPTDLQIADFFTKRLGPGPYIIYRRRFMSLCPRLLT